MDRMKKGIRCNEVRFTNGDKRDRIKFEFVSDDGVTPSSCTVCVGDIDPMTGEKITDVTFFREYYRVVDHQVHQNLKAERIVDTPEEKAKQEIEKRVYVEEFVKRWGYAPSKDDVQYYLETIGKERYKKSLSQYIDDVTGDNTIDFHMKLSLPYETNQVETIEMQALLDVAAQLDGRKADVYTVMINRASGNKENYKYVDIAKKWGVSPKQINKDKKRIIYAVKKRANFLYQMGIKIKSD